MAQKTKEVENRLLLVGINILLTLILSVFVFLLNLGVQVSKDVKEWKEKSLISQQETTSAVNNLRMSLIVLENRIDKGETKDILQDTEIKKLDYKVEETKKRVNILEGH